MPVSLCVCLLQIPLNLKNAGIGIDIKLWSTFADGEAEEIQKLTVTDYFQNKSASATPKENNTMTTTTTSNAFVDRIDPFAKRSLKKKQKKSQGSSRYHQANEADMVPLPLFKGSLKKIQFPSAKFIMLIAYFSN